MFQDEVLWRRQVHCSRCCACLEWNGFLNVGVACRVFLNCVFEQVCVPLDSHVQYWNVRVPVSRHRFIVWTRCWMLAVYSRNKEILVAFDFCFLLWKEILYNGTGYWKDSVPIVFLLHLNYWDMHAFVSHFYKDQSSIAFAMDMYSLLMWASAE